MFLGIEDADIFTRGLLFGKFIYTGNRQLCFSYSICSLSRETVIDPVGLEKPSRYIKHCFWKFVISGKYLSQTPALVL